MSIEGLPLWWAFTAAGVVMGGLGLIWRWRNPPGPNWGSFAAHFPETPHSPHTILYDQSAELGPDWLEHILTFELSDTHLRISMARPFRWLRAASPFSIPLDDILLVGERQGRWFPLVPRARVKTESLPNTRFRISNELASKLAVASRGALRMVYPDGRPYPLDPGIADILPTRKDEGRWAVLRSTRRGGDRQIAVYGNRASAEQHAERLRDAGLEHRFWVEQR